MSCAICEETSGYFILLVSLQLYVSQEALLMKLPSERGISLSSYLNPGSGDQLIINGNMLRNQKE